MLAKIAGGGASANKASAAGVALMACAVGMGGATNVEGARGRLESRAKGTCVPPNLPQLPSRQQTRVQHQARVQHQTSRMLAKIAGGGASANKASAAGVALMACAVGMGGATKVEGARGRLESRAKGTCVPPNLPQLPSLPLHRSRHVVTKVQGHAQRIASVSAMALFQVSCAAPVLSCVVCVSG